MGVKKPSADQYGFGLFAMQDIEPNKIITLYLGEQYHSVEEKDKSKVGDTYTLLSHVTFDDRNSWNKNKKRKMFVAPHLKDNKWQGNVDEIYIGAHLINEFQNSKKKSANAIIGDFFEISSVQKIKRGEEILVNYNCNGRSKFSE